MKKLILLLVFFMLNKFTFCQVWNSYFGDSLYSDGALAAIYSLYNYNNKLFVGGAFQKAGNKQANGLAVSKNFLWDTLSCGPAGPANSVLNYNSNVFVGYKSINNICYFYDFPNGILNTINIAGWNGLQWFALSNIYPNDEVMSLCEFNNSLYIGGRFNKIGTTWYGKIARYDGSYHQVGVQGLTLNGTSTVNDMLVFNNKLIVGGYFYADSLNNVAAWDGSQWGKVGNGLNSYVNKLELDTVNNWLYAGGSFYISGDSVSQGGWCIAKLDGMNWRIVGGGANCDIMAMAHYRGNLFVSGCFDNIGGKPITSFAKWNGIEWDSVPGAPNGYNTIANTMTVYNDELVIGGSIDSLDGQRAHGLARYYLLPDSTCLYFSPAIYTDKDTFYLTTDTGKVQFYSNSLHGSAWLWNFADSFTDTSRLPKHTYTDSGTYTVSLTLTEAHCTKTVYKNVVLLDTVTGINQQPTANSQHPTALKIYPNPASGSITIEVTSAVNHEVIEQFDKLTVSPVEMPNDVRGNAGSSSRELRITDQNGKLIKSYQIKEPNSKFEINIKGWAKGTYLCSLVVSNKTVKVEKLVIE